MKINVKQCQQCGKIGLALEGGRCSWCRHRTSAQMFHELHPEVGVRLDLFGRPEQTVSMLVTTLFPEPDSSRVVNISDIGDERRMVYIERAGRLFGHYSFPVGPENMPSNQEIIAALLGAEK